VTQRQFSAGVTVMVQAVAVLAAGQQIPVVMGIKAAPPNNVVQANGLAPPLDVLGMPAHGTAFSHEGIGFKLAADAV
jgi:hypothetical protein